MQVNRIARDRFPIGLTWRTLTLECHSRRDRLPWYRCQPDGIPIVDTLRNMLSSISSLLSSSPFPSVEKRRARIRREFFGILDSCHWQSSTLTRFSLTVNETPIVLIQTRSSYWHYPRITIHDRSTYTTGPYIYIRIYIFVYYLL